MIYETNAVEAERVREFAKKHKHYSGACGGHISVSFSPTGLGTAVCVHCCMCKTFRNVTDWDLWT